MALRCSSLGQWVGGDSCVSSTCCMPMPDDRYVRSRARSGERSPTQADARTSLAKPLVVPGRPATHRAHDDDPHALRRGSAMPQAADPACCTAA
jgi:hypothetical protein